MLIKAIFFSLIKPEKKQAIITDLLLQDVRYCQTFIIKTWEELGAFPLQLFVPEALNGGRKNGSSCCLGCVEEVSVSYYEDRTEALLFSPCLSVSPRSCLPSLLSIHLLVLCTFCQPVAFFTPLTFPCFFFSFFLVSKW